MAENTSEAAGSERRVGPTVSRDRWMLHARQKLSRGYVLILAGGDKRRANFYLPEKGYEMCAYDVARALVQSGEVVPTGEHPLGTRYELPAARA
jgi:hypothetical protein